MSLPRRQALALRWSKQILHAITRLVPSSDRNALRTFSEPIFDDLAREALHARGVPGLAALLLRCVLDILRAAAILHRKAPQSNRNRARRSTLMRRIVHDVTTATIAIRRRPGLALASALTLAVGLAASLSIFSVVYGVLLRPLGLDAPDRLVNVQQAHETSPADWAGFSPGELRLLRENNRSTADIAGWFYDSLTLEAGGAYRGDPLELSQAIVATPNLFDVLGTTPLAGRLFARDDAIEGAGRGKAVVLGSRLHQTLFAADPEIVGETLRIDGRTVTIVGVVASTLPAPSVDTDVWWATGLDPSDRALIKRLQLVARLAPQSDLETAQGDLRSVYQRASEDTPRLASWTPQVTAFRSDLLGAVESGLWMSFAGAALLLVLAGANFANLMLARAAGRRVEYSTRICLGASRTRLFSQLTAESLLIALLAGVIAIGLAFAMQASLLASAADLLPRADAVRLDAPVLLFVVAAALSCGFVFGSGPSAFSVLGRLSGRGVRGNGSERQSLRGVLAATQVATAVVLLLAAGALGISFHQLIRTDPGFDIDRVAAARIYLDDDRYSTIEQERAYFDELRSRLSQHPWVEKVATTTSLPMDAETVDFDVPYRPADRPQDDEVPTQAFVRFASPDYFETLGIQLYAGRTFAQPDLTGPPVVVINRAMAELAWPDRSAVGELLIAPIASSEPLEVVGVVDDASFAHLGARAKPEMFFPKQRFSFGGRTVVVRTDQDPALLLDVLNRTALEIDPRQPVSQAMTLESLAATTVAAERFYSELSRFIGILAIVLALSGIYALGSFWVSGRRFEIGLRVAVGATRAGVLRLVMVRALLWTAVGAGAGLLLGNLLLRRLGEILYEVDVFDWRVLLPTVAVVFATAVFASLQPARRALEVEPADVLRR